MQRACYVGAIDRPRGLQSGHGKPLTLLTSFDSNITTTSTHLPTYPLNHLPHPTGHNLETAWVVSDTLDHLAGAISAQTAQAYRSAALSFGAAAGERCRKHSGLITACITCSTRDACRAIAVLNTAIPREALDGPARLSLDASRALTRVHPKTLRANF